MMQPFQVVWLSGVQLPVQELLFVLPQPHPQYQPLPLQEPLLSSQLSVSVPVLVQRIQLDEYVPMSLALTSRLNGMIDT
jgi:hypothetical protein